MKELILSLLLFAAIFSCGNNASTVIEAPNMMNQNQSDLDNLAEIVSVEVNGNPGSYTQVGHIR